MSFEAPRFPINNSDILNDPFTHLIPALSHDEIDNEAPVIGESLYPAATDKLRRKNNENEPKNGTTGSLDYI